MTPTSEQKGIPNKLIQQICSLIKGMAVVDSTVVPKILQGIDDVILKQSPQFFSAEDTEEGFESMMEAVAHYVGEFKVTNFPSCFRIDRALRLPPVHVVVVREDTGELGFIYGKREGEEV